MNAVGQRPSDRSAGVESTQDRDGLDRGLCKLWGHVVGDTRQPHNFDSKTLSGCDGALEIRATEVLKTEGQGAA